MAVGTVTITLSSTVAVHAAFSQGPFSAGVAALNVESSPWLVEVGDYGSSISLAKGGGLIQQTDASVELSLSGGWFSALKAQGGTLRGASLLLTMGASSWFGRVTGVRLTDSTVTVEAEAILSGWDRSVPSRSVTATDYPDAPTSSLGKVAPLAFGVGVKAMAYPISSGAAYKDVCSTEFWRGHPIGGPYAYLTDPFNPPPTKPIGTGCVLDYTAKTNVTRMGATARSIKILLQSKTWIDRTRSAGNDPVDDPIIVYTADAGGFFIPNLTEEFGTWSVPKWYRDWAAGAVTWIKFGGILRRLISPAVPSNVPETVVYQNALGLSIYPGIELARGVPSGSSVVFETTVTIAIASDEEDNPVGTYNDCEIYSDLNPSFLVPGGDVTAVGKDLGVSPVLSFATSIDPKTQFPILQYASTAISKFGGIPMGMYVPLSTDYLNRDLNNSADDIDIQDRSLATWKDVVVQGNMNPGVPSPPLLREDWYFREMMYRATLSTSYLFSNAGEWQAKLKETQAEKMFVWLYAGFPAMSTLSFGVQLHCMHNEIRKWIPLPNGPRETWINTYPSWFSWLDTSGPTPGRFPLDQLSAWEIDVSPHRGITGMTLEIEQDPNPSGQYLQVYQAGVFFYTGNASLTESIEIQVTNIPAIAAGIADYASFLHWLVTDVANAGGTLQSAALMRNLAPDMARPVRALLDQEARLVDIVDRIGQEANAVIRYSGTAVDCKGWLNRVGSTEYDWSIDGTTTALDTADGVLEGSARMNEQPITEVCAYPRISYDWDGAQGRFLGQGAVVDATVDSGLVTEATASQYSSGWQSYPDARRAWDAANEAWRLHGLQQSVAREYKYLDCTSTDTLSETALQAPHGGVSLVRWAAMRKEVFQLSVSEDHPIAAALPGDRVRVRDYRYTGGVYIYGTLCEITVARSQSAINLSIILDIPLPEDIALVDALSAPDDTIDTVNPSDDTLTDTITV